MNIFVETRAKNRSGNRAIAACNALFFDKTIETTKNLFKAHYRQPRRSIKKQYPQSAQIIPITGINL
ncbi:hypothetical protein C7B77_17690 [Chamaesiphon polymorphus CCALA 037]|uniref:Uncharacterized protein n=1 Tax=Chamaesiphon polymorphus CCALA 037 TaxID=2107692 RepID=A0A2T1GBB0_9CYAN|nr:hypothetical protein C7B77_17690 [Chamaesiphon polymorphus CCALA 037]